MLIELMLFIVSQPPLPAASQIPLAAPPPPPVKEAPKPATPQRIRVGGQVQAANFLTLGATWLDWPRPGNEQLETDERTLINDPDDVCAHGRLIAFMPEPERAVRAEHLVWMIQHYPEWDGFSLEPERALTRPGRESETYIGLINQLKIHWLKQVGPEQKNAMVLHNAAMFFGIREPEVAESLLKRSMVLDPAEPLYRERLGLVYRLAQTPVQFLQHYGVVDSPERAAFAQHASEILNSDRSLSGVHASGSRRFHNTICQVP